MNKFRKRWFGGVVLVLLGLWLGRVLAAEANTPAEGDAAATQEEPQVGGKEEVILYRGSVAESEYGLKLGGWGSGKAEEDDSCGIDNKAALWIKTFDYYRGGRLDFTNGPRIDNFFGGNASDSFLEIDAYFFKPQAGGGMAPGTGLGAAGAGEGGPEAGGAAGQPEQGTMMGAGGLMGRGLMGAGQPGAGGPMGGLMGEGMMGAGQPGAGGPMGGGLMGGLMGAGQPGAGGPMGGGLMGGGLMGEGMMGAGQPGAGGPMGGGLMGAGQPGAGGLMGGGLMGGLMGAGQPGAGGPMGEGMMGAGQPGAGGPMGGLMGGLMGAGQPGAGGPMGGLMGGGAAGRGMLGAEAGAGGAEAGAGMGAREERPPISKLRIVLETTEGPLVLEDYEFNRDFEVVPGWTRLLIPLSAFKNPGNITPSKLKRILLFGNEEDEFFIARAKLVRDTGPLLAKIQTTKKSFPWYMGYPLTLPGYVLYGTVYSSDLEYTWDFGDGKDQIKGPPEGQKFTGGAVQGSHTYEITDQERDVTITLTAIDPSGHKPPASDSVTVQLLKPPGYQPRAGARATGGRVQGPVH